MAKTMEELTLDKAVTSLESSELAKSEVAEVKKMVQQGKSWPKVRWLRSRRW